MSTTRYFIFSKASPTDGDEEKIINSCKLIDAFLCYARVRNEVRKRDYLRGAIILRGPRANIDGRSLRSYFPNMMLRYIGRMDFDIDSLPDGVKVVGEHPFKRLRKTLFPSPSSLSYFLKST